MGRNKAVCWPFRLLAAVALTIGATVIAGKPAQAQLLGPSPYVSFANSPFSGLTFSDYFHLETFEDSLLNTPGVTASAGSPLGPSGITDSVDADDGTIDGSGIAGHSFFAGSGATGISFTFSTGTLGGLPTHAGVVWTDGSGTITFQAFDAASALIGTLNGNHADGSSGGTTGEDRFYGVIAPGGISRIFISNAGGGIEVDHLQYGRGTGVASAAAPEPMTYTFMSIGLLPLYRRVRRGKIFRLSRCRGAF